MYTSDKRPKAAVIQPAGLADLFPLLIASHCHPPEAMRSGNRSAEKSENWGLDLFLTRNPTAKMVVVLICFSNFKKK